MSDSHAAPIPPNPEFHPQGPEKDTNWLNWILSIFVLALLILVIWLGYPVVKRLAFPNPTATPVPSATLHPTLPPTQTATPTIIPTATNTPYPLSAYQADGKALNPPLRGADGTIYVLNEDKALVDPPLIHPQWVSSDQIAKQFNADISDPFYATFGAGSVTWQMDVPIPPGYYELFVMDTLYSSAGWLNYEVFQGSTPLKPLFGQQSVLFQSSRFEPVQEADQWHSIGIYKLETNEILTVHTSWKKRDEYSIVAIDRVVVVPQGNIPSQMLAALPLGQTMFALDDSAADLDSKGIWYTQESPDAWRGSYRYMVNPAQNSAVHWVYGDALPTGTYQVVLWVPKAKGNVEVTCQLLANGKELYSKPPAVKINLGGRSRSEWVVVGVWNVDPKLYGQTFRAQFDMNIPGGSAGEAVIDMLLLMKAP